MVSCWPAYAAGRLGGTENHDGVTLQKLIKSLLRFRCPGVACLLLCFGLFSPLAQAVSAYRDQTCAGYRFGSALNCTAGEFTVGASFSADNGTPPFCMAGQSFEFKVNLSLSGSNTDRQDIGFFVGQEGNDPGAVTAGNICSVATFPNGPAPWENNDLDSCGDYNGGGVSTDLIDQIKVVCTGGATGALQVPYTLTYWQNNGNVCTGYTDVVGGSKSKCNSGTALVDGVVSVSSGYWFDIIKDTDPDGDSQSFSFTATGPAGTKVIAVTGATLTDTSVTGGTYNPTTISAATNSTTFSLQHGQTARVFVTALSGNQNLQVVESSVSGWDPTVSFNCVSVGTSSPTYTTNGATRTAIATLNATNVAGRCTFTNTKRPTVTITKVSNGDVGTFTFTGTNGWSTQNIATSVSGVGVSGSTQVLTQSVSTEITESLATGFQLNNIACTGDGGSAAVDVANRRVTLGSGVMAPGAVINCTFTNGRERTFTVLKSLSPVTPPSGDNGLFVMNANGATGSAGGNGASASAAVAVGASVSFSEAAGSGTDLNNYNASYSCNTTPVTSGSGSSGSLTMPNSDVTCTITNTRKSASLTLAKQWVNGVSGDTATVTSSGFTNNASSGASVSSGNNTTTGSTVTVYAAESGTLAESFSVGSSSNYLATLACTGTSGLSGSSLTVGTADSTIACTYTNTAKPILSVLKLSSVVSDPVNNVSNPKSIPGSVVAYTIQVSNTGPGSVDNNSVIVIDPIPANLELFVNDLGGAGSGPVLFTDGSPSSGLGWSFVSLADNSDSVDFSSDNGTTWTYTPTPDADGFDASVTHIRLKPSGSMNPDTGTDPYFELRFRARLQ